MTRVVHLTSVHPWNDVRIFRKMACSLAAAGFDTHLVAIDREAGETREFVSDGVTVHLLAGNDIVGRWQRFWVGGRRASAFAAGLRPDILHFHDPELVPLVSGVHRSTRIIYDSHESLPDQIHAKNWIPPAFKPPFRTFAQLLEVWATHRFSGIVGATPAIAARFPKGKSLAIQNYPIAGEFANWDAAGATGNAWDHRPQSGVYIGAISRARGILPLVEGIGRSKLLDRFILVGRFEDAALQAEAAALPGWAKVDYRGQLPREQLAQLMGNTRFGAVTFLPYPNHTEAQPNKMFEYLSAGLPVLASDFPLWRQILGGDLAVYTDPSDANAIGAAIDQLLSLGNTEQGARSKLATNAVERSLNWNSEAAALVRYYESLLGSPAPAVA